MVTAGKTAGLLPAIILRALMAAKIPVAADSI